MASKAKTPALIPIRGQGHQSEIVFFCKDCSGQLVWLKYATSIHQRHKFENTSDITLSEETKTSSLC